MTSYVLDACAVIAYLNDETGSDKVEALLQSNSTIFMSAINVLEVCYDVVRNTGNSTDAQAVLHALSQWPIIIVHTLDEPVLLAAAIFKARGKTSLADSVALGLAQIEQAKLVTADHHEFDRLEQDGLAQFEWIR